MVTNTLFSRIVSALRLTEDEILEAYRLAGFEMSYERLASLLEDGKNTKCTYEELGLFLDGLIALKRGKSPNDQDDETTVALTNNLILKKLRIALELKEPQIEIIFNLADLNPTKQQLSALFRKEGSKNFKPCSDELLMSFLEGLDEYYFDINQARS